MLKKGLFTSKHEHLSDADKRDLDTLLGGPRNQQDGTSPMTGILHRFPDGRTPFSKPWTARAVVKHFHDQGRLNFTVGNVNGYRLRNFGKTRRPKSAAREALKAVFDEAGLRKKYEMLFDAWSELRARLIDTEKRLAAVETNYDVRLSALEGIKPQRVAQ